MSSNKNAFMSYNYQNMCEFDMETRKQADTIFCKKKNDIKK